MFSTFSVEPSTAGEPARRASHESTRSVDRPRAKRTPVPVACDHCRKNRIRCNNSKPCNNCKNRNLTCLHSDVADSRGLIRQVQNLVGKVEELENRLQQRPQDVPAARSAQPPLSLQTPPSSSYSPESAQTPATSPCRPRTTTSATQTDVGQLTVNLSSHAFAKRLDQSLQRPSWSLSHSVSLLSFRVPEPSANLRSSRHSDPINLLRNDEEYYIRLFWRQVHRTFPVLGEDDFTAHYASLWDIKPGQCTRRASNLVDIVLALAVQLDSDTRPQLHHQINFSNTANGLDHTRATAQDLYQSCLRGLDREWESPTLGTLQCYILMVAYLRKEGRHNSAYQILGFAVRVSNILETNQPALSSVSPKELLLREHMQDFLFCLDTQQFLELARPCSFASNVSQRHVENESQDACYWYFWSDLLAIAKSIQQTMSSMVFNPGAQLDERICPHGPLIRSFERLLPSLMMPLSLWAKTVPSRLHLRRISSGSPFSNDVAVDIDADIPIWQVRQSLLLEISYHWVKMSITRWFLDQQGIEDEQNNDRFDHYGEQAVECAFTIIEILTRAHNNTEAIRGWYDAHLIHWDAVLVLFGYTLWRYNGPKFDRVLMMLDKCGSTFQSLGTSVPRRASAIIKEFTVCLNQRRGSQQSLSIEISENKSPALFHMNEFCADIPHLSQTLLDSDLLTTMEFELDMETLGCFPQLQQSMLINDGLNA